MNRSRKRMRDESSWQVKKNGLSNLRLSTIIASRQFDSLPEAIRSALDEKLMISDIEVMSIKHSFPAIFSDSGSSQGSSNITSLSSEFSAFKKFVTQALGNLQRQIELLFHNVDRIEMQTRRKILLGHGVPESKEDLAKSVVKVLQDHLKVPSFSEAAI
ncbi:hypothetical protein K1T71_014710 [Dendrolimus kikuchii]|nr:hypothetical protein K1T71_014710 [Dendrolimus kikuchii]